jgi:hypothetical protein
MGDMYGFLQSGKLSLAQSDRDCLITYVLGLLGCAVVAVGSQRNCSKQYRRYPAAEHGVYYRNYEIPTVRPIETLRLFDMYF